jgi:hypothetical protein
LIVSVSDTLDNSLFYCLVTICRPLPANWASVSISQNSKTIDPRIVPVNTVKCIMFDVVPDNGDITNEKIDHTNTSGSYNIFPSKSRVMQNYHSPFNPSTILNYYLSISTNVLMKIYSLFGEELETLTSRYQSEDEYEIAWHQKNIAHGIYLCKLYASTFSETKTTHDAQMSVSS